MEEKCVFYFVFGKVEIANLHTQQSISLSALNVYFNYWPKSRCPKQPINVIKACNLTFFETFWTCFLYISGGTFNSKKETFWTFTTNFSLLKMEASHFGSIITIFNFFWGSSFSYVQKKEFYVCNYGCVHFAIA